MIYIKSLPSVWWIISALYMHAHSACTRKGSTLCFGVMYTDKKLEQFLRTHNGCSYDIYAIGK